MPLPPDPEDRAAFVRRLAATAEVVGSVSALAKRAGLSQAGVRSYLIRSEPTHSKLHSLARAAGVNPGWLSFGGVPMCQPGSEVALRAEAELRADWIGRVKAQGCELSWEAFRSESAAGNIEGIPSWITFALAQPPQPPLQEADADDGALSAQTDVVLGELREEVRRWIVLVGVDAHAHATIKAAMSEVCGLISDAVLKSQVLPRPDTLRALLLTEIFRLDPTLPLRRVQPNAAAPSTSPADVTTSEACEGLPRGGGARTN